MLDINLVKKKRKKEKSHLDNKSYFKKKQDVGGIKRTDLYISLFLSNMQKINAAINCSCLQIMCGSIILLIVSETLFLEQYALFVPTC